MRSEYHVGKHLGARSLEFRWVTTYQLEKALDQPRTGVQLNVRRQHIVRVGECESKVPANANWVIKVISQPVGVGAVEINKK